MSASHERTSEDSLAVPPPLLTSFISTRDKRIAKIRPWSTTVLSNHFFALLRGEEIIVGGRATCGTYVDPTWIELTLWKEVVAKARKLGFNIDETPIKQKNGWATKAGGFWEESAFKLVVTSAKDTP